MTFYFVVNPIILVVNPSYFFVNPPNLVVNPPYLVVNPQFCCYSPNLANQVMPQTLQMWSSDIKIFAFRSVLVSPYKKFLRKYTSFAKENQFPTYVIWRAVNGGLNWTRFIYVLISHSVTVSHYHRCHDIRFLICQELTTCPKIIESHSFSGWFWRL